MKTIFVAVISILFFVYSCSSPSKQEENENVSADTITTQIISKPVTADNSMNSLDWAGNYSGILPCADCEGIETNLQIENNFSYRVTRKYIGKSNKNFSDTGNFKWNEAGSIITLENASKVYVKFFVGENYLLQLDADGNEITGELAANYRLNKNQPAPVPSTNIQPRKKVQNTTPEKNAEIKKVPLNIEGNKWVLIELNGKPVEQNDAAKQVIYFMLDTTQKYITGFGGCNQFFGGYQIKEPFQIKFQKMTTTMKACDQMETESELLKTLDRVDNYTVNGNVLSLNIAKMAPLARFERGK